MKAYFELDDRGTCASFTIVRGKTREHQFLKHPSGCSRLSFEGTREQFDALMRDIYAEFGPAFRTRAIFVYPEIPDVGELKAANAMLTAANGKLQLDVKDLSDELNVAVQEIGRLRKARKPSAFPPADFVPKPTTLNVGIPSDGDDSDDLKRLDTPRLANGSASLDPDAEAKHPGPVLSRQQKAANTRRAQRGAALGFAPSAKPKKAGKRK